MIKIKFVYGFLPALVVYTDRISVNSAGCANAMIVRILPRCVSDEGLLQHQLTHVRQSYRLLLLIHALLYRFSRCYRLDAEVEAYRKQLEYSVNRDADIVFFAIMIRTKYDLPAVYPSAAEALLREA